MKPFICLGIESTADNLGIGIVTSEGQVLANEVKVHIPKEGGIHPREAARHHSENIGAVMASSIDKAKLCIDDIDIIAFSQGPGLGPCLRTGATAARAMSSYLKKPLIGVNHCVGHIEIGRLSTGANDPLTLYVSGGNSMVSGYESGKYRVFGETLDIAIGNCLDTFARIAGLEYPGGPAIEKLALKGSNLIPLPYVVKGMDMSFSGLLTAVLNEYNSGKHELADLCYSLQETGYSALGEVTERALAHTKKQELLLTGGVGANKRLKNIIKCIAEEQGAQPYYVPINFATDNGAMIAWTGVLAYKEGVTIPIEHSYVNPKWRLDEVNIQWRI